ncbi:ABC transporter permease [Corynebacterium sp.]|uniref:ABC transporter permease n=1 Tax=Corynebacterium sp. TaxID=1720 RepID=UPI0025B9C9DF|nr:ABC transporter permease [Corynebacterium sp.]
MIRNRQSTGRFTPGQFTPRPRQAPTGRMLLAQARIETLLFLRHGEQQLLSLVIPLGLLIALSLIPVVPLDDPVQSVYPMTVGIALMSAGFTGQAIAVAFDRRYGALKRIGACGVPRRILISGKVLAVGAAVLVQLVVLTVVALLLGWSPSAAGALPAVLFIVVGVATFTALGLLLGGTLSSELVLALGNTVWFILMGAAVLTTMNTDISGPVHAALRALPSVALTDGLVDAAAGTLNVAALLVLAAWGAVGGALAVRYFSFTMEND